MNCNEALQNLEPALDGALDTAAQRALHEHVATCALCKQKLSQLEGVHALLRESSLTTPAESLDARVMGSFRRHHAAKPGRRTDASRLRDLFFASLRVPVPVMAMSAVAVVAIVFVAYTIGKQNAQYVVVNPPEPRSGPSHATDSPGGIYKTDPVDKTVVTNGTTRVHASADRKRTSRFSASVRNELTQQPIKSSTLITSNSTSYSTLAVLNGFEPLPIATARIIKGEQ